MEVIYCVQCKHFDGTGRKDYHCKNLQGLSFPGPGDYCSRAEKKDEEVDLMNALLQTLN